MLYEVLSGKPPFGDEVKSDINTLYSNIRVVNYNFNDPIWDGISKGAKDIISKFLVRDPSLRLEAGNAINHSWTTSKDIKRRVDTTFKYSAKKKKKVFSSTI